MIVYFTGTDGSGKTTVISEMVNSIPNNYNIKVIWARYESKVVSILIKRLKSSKTKSSNNYNNMSLNDYVSWKMWKKKYLKLKIINKIFLLIQALDYSLQIRSTNKIIKNNTGLVILDRYLLDFLVDQTLNYGDISQTIIYKYMFKKLAALDYIILLDVPYRTAMERKSDIPGIQYLADRREIFVKLTLKLNNVHWIDNNKSITDTITEIKKILWGI